MKRLWIACLAATLTLAGCWGRGCGSVHVPQINTPQLTRPPLAHGIAVLDWVTGVSIGIAFLCVVGCVVGAGLGIVGIRATKVLRRLGAAMVGTFFGALMLKVVVVEYLWLAILLAAAFGAAASVLFAWGHRAWIERFLNIDLDRSGRIGDEVVRVNGAIPLPQVPPERLP